MSLFCGHESPWSVAGNGRMMAATKAALKSRKKSNKNLKSAPKPASPTQPASEIKDKPGRKPGCKPRGRKATTCRKVKPGVAGSNLRNAINVAVASQPDVIAKALVEETIKGNVGSAKLLIGITGADKPDEKKKRKGYSLAEELRLGPQWQGPPEGDPDEDLGVPFGPPEPLF